MPIFNIPSLASCVNVMKIAGTHFSSGANVNASQILISFFQFTYKESFLRLGRALKYFCYQLRITWAIKVCLTSCLPDCWKVSLLVPVFKNVDERPTTKNHHPVSLLSVVSKVFENFVSNIIVNHKETCCLFSDFQYDFRSSQSTPDLLTVLSDRAFYSSGATQAVALDISKAFDRVWHAGLPHKVKSSGILVRYLALFLFSVIYSFKWFRMATLHKNIQKRLVDFIARKTQLVLFDRSKNIVSIDVKIDRSVLEEKSSFKVLGLTFCSKLDWGSFIISIAKTAPKKIGALIHSMKFLSPEVALYLYKFTIPPCMEYCCHIWAGAPCCYLESLNKL